MQPSNFTETEIYANLDPKAANTERTWEAHTEKKEYMCLIQGSPYESCDRMCTPLYPSNISYCQVSNRHSPHPAY